MPSLPRRFLRYTPTDASLSLDRLILERGACAACSSEGAVVFHRSDQCPILRESDE